MRTARPRRALVAGAATLALVAPLVLTAAPASAHDRPRVRITTVLSGLAAPRGITFDDRGAMYVAESGTAGSGPVGINQTGAVSKYRLGHDHPVWSVPFSTVWAAEEPGQPPDMLGPEGLSATCERRHHHRSSCTVSLIMSLSEPGVQAESGGAVTDPQAGHLFRLDARTGAATDKADVGTQQYTWTGDHKALFPDDFPDSNPFGVLITRDKHSHHTRTFVADAGANTISEVMRDGTTRVIAYIPNETEPPLRDSTPTCIARGPDGYLYVGTLDLVANAIDPATDNRSHVYRVDPNADFPTVPTVWASGLSTITSCTFDRSGNFWATEMFKGGMAATPPGDVVRIPWNHPTRQQHLGFGSIPLPGGIAQGPDGAMYVTTGSAAPGNAGGVVRISTERHHR